MNENDDHCGREERGDLKQDEDWVVSMQGQGADHDAAREPHPPRARADSGRAVLARKVDDLREISERVVSAARRHGALAPVGMPEQRLA